MTNEMKKKEPTIDELYVALDELGFDYEVCESFEGLEVVNFLVSPTDEEDEDEDKDERVARRGARLGGGKV
jgi:hypothetical protein